MASGSVVPGICDGKRSPIKEDAGEGLTESKENTIGSSASAPCLRTPHHRYGLLSNPLSAPHGQDIALGDKTLIELTDQHYDAMPADLII